MRKTESVSELQQESFFLNDRFNDFDDFAHTVRAWDLDFCQLDCGRFQADMLQFGVNSTQIAHAKFNRRLDQKGSPPKGLWTFALLSEQSPSIIWRGQEVSSDTLLVYHPGSEINCVSEQGFEVFTLSLPDRVLSHAVRIFGYDDFQCLIGDKDSATGSIVKLDEVRRHVRSLISEIQKSPYLLSDDFELELSCRLLNCLGNAHLIRNSSPYRKRDRALRQISIYLENHPDEPLTVQDLCNLTGVSRRTIEYVFLEHFGVSPKTYLKAFRLNGVRRELKRGNESFTGISDLANKWGFWHIGQFSADFRRLFGKLPSEMLAEQKASK